MFTSPRPKKKRSRPLDHLQKPKQDLLKPSITVETQEKIPLFSYSEVPYCIFCKRTSAPLIKLPSGIFINLTGYVHEICLKNKGCCECGILGLCYRCTVKDCSRLIHSWCAVGMHGNPNFCDLHSVVSKKKESARLPFVKSICRKVLSSGFWEKDYKEKDSPASFCNGHIFWYLLGLEYFPPGFDLACFPTFPQCRQFDLDYESFSGSNMTKMIEKVSSDLEKVQSSNSRLVLQVQESLASKTKNMSKDFNDIQDYFSLMERIPHDDGVDLETGKGLNEPCEDDKMVKNICDVCRDLDDQNLMQCETCKIFVHAKCYKVQISDCFTCELCLFYGKTVRVDCVLCPIKDGIFKQTLHLVKDILFPSYMNELVKDGKQPIWVHSFCALHTSGVVYRNTGVDLSGIDTSKLNIFCEICRQKVGLSIQCSFSRCSVHFHANCGRDLFVSTKSSEKKIFCSLHKPVKLRKLLEARQRQLHEDIYKFSKAMDKYFARVKIQVKVLKKKKKSKQKLTFGKNFSMDEDLLFEYRVQQFLYKLNVSQKKPFLLEIDLKASTRCSRVNVTRPAFYTLIAPSVVLEENITIEGRSAEECFKRYQDTLYNKLKNEILLLGQRLCIYQGKELPQVKHYSKPKKRAVEAKFKISADTYCICNQPYYYEIPWMAEWSQEQWEEKIRENEMIECTKCEKWFHLKCVGYEGSLEKAQQDENWKCGTCDEKKGFRETGSTELTSGVVTRRWSLTDTSNKQKQ